MVSNLTKADFFLTVNQARITICKKETAFTIFKKLRRSINLLKYDCITFAAFSGSMMERLLNQKKKMIDHNFRYKSKKEINYASFINSHRDQLPKVILITSVNANNVFDWR